MNCLIEILKNPQYPEKLAGTGRDSGYKMMAGFKQV